MRKLFTVLALLCLIFTGFAVAAQDSLAVDETGLLSGEEVEGIDQQCRIASERLGLKVTVLFTNENFEGEPYRAAADYYDRFYGGVEGVILYVNFNTRDYAVVSSGAVIDRELSEKPVAYILDNYIHDQLVNGDYSAAVASYIEGLDYVFAHYEDFVKKPLSMAEKAGIAAIIAAFGGLIAGLIPMLIAYYQLKNCAPKKEAQDYIDPQRVKISRSGDLFLYRAVQKVRIEQPSAAKNNGGSIRFEGSGGSSHVGGSRKF